MKEYRYTINGTKYEVAIGDIEENIVTVNVNGDTYKVEMEKQPEPEKKPVVRPVVAAPAVNKSANKAYAVKAPLPGVIMDIKVAVGDEVQADDTVVVLEAMKMNNNLETEKTGKVTAVCVQVGQSVMEGDDLIVIE